MVRRRQKISLQLIPRPTLRGAFSCLEVGTVSKKAQKRVARRLRLLGHVSKPVDPLPPLPRPKVKEPFYLHELGLTRECCGDCPAWADLPIVIRRPDPARGNGT